MPSFSEENDFSSSTLGTPRRAFLMARPIFSRWPGLLPMVCALLLLLAVPEAPAQPRAADPVAAAQRDPDPLPGARRRVPAAAAGDTHAEATMPLRLSEELSVAPATSDLGRQLLRLEQRTIEILRDANTDQQMLSDKLAWLEANVAELRRAEDRLAGVAAAIPSPTAAPPRGAAAAAALPPAVPAALPAAIPAGPAVAMEFEQWILYAGVAALVVVLMLLFRRPAVAEVLPASPNLPSMPDRSEPVLSNRPKRSGSAPPAVAPVERATRREMPAARAAAPVTPASPPKSPPATPDPAAIPVSAPALSIVPEVAGTTPILELAEVMLSFGRVTNATKTLEEYLAAQPQESLRPWIRLLQIYQHNGMRDEFEALTLRLNRAFNVEVIRWDANEARKQLHLVALDAPPEKATTLEDLPHIRDQLIALWGKPECPVYLEKLLRDHRDGQRSGFTLPVVEEMLFLIDLTVACEAAQPSIPTL